MVQINEIVPSKFRSGDLISIRGFGFAPTFGDNAVAVDGIPEPVQYESATEIQIFVPAGIAEDAYVPVYVFRTDTLDNDALLAWSEAPLDDLRSGVSQPPGQIPGVEEAADPSRVEDTPQAQDYERMVVAIRHLLLDVLGNVGDLFATDGAGLTPQAVGAAGQRLGANPANPTGLEYAAIARAHSFAWGGLRQAANVTLNPLVANGDANQISFTAGEHFALATGSIRSVLVHFGEGGAGDTLDQVSILINGVTQYDSGTGLGVVPGSFFAAAIAVAITGGVDRVELRVKKAGTNADARFLGYVGVR